MYCCTQCFDNLFIKEQIISSDNIGDCNYCGSQDEYIEDVGDLGDYIRECLSKAYANATTDSIPYKYLQKEATTIDDVLRYTEEIFSEDIDFVSGQTERLLKDLFTYSGPSDRDIQNGDIDEYEGGDAEIVLINSFYGPDFNRFNSTWDYFTYTVKHVNRFFDVTSNRATRESMLNEFDVFFRGMEKELPIGYEIWRGRLNPEEPYDTESQKTSTCGPPPRKCACSLRMNPAGISYFYGAEEQLTSEKEIRAEEGDTVIYGLFETIKKLKIIDLSEIPRVFPGSIFSPDYNHELRWASYFLSSFRDEISKPINEKEKDIEYLPTQILTEYIRAKGYDGIRYMSSITKGANLTLFCGPNEDSSTNYVLQELNVFPFTDWLKMVDFQIAKI